MTDDKLTEPLEVLQALDAIEDGATANSLESQTLDFKEDPAVHPQNGNPDASLVEFLADETVCFSNGDGGVSYIVLGVSDKTPGQAAFTGTNRDPDWIVRKIYNNTQPHIQVEITPVERAGKRLLIIRVPRGLTLYQRPKGQASRRIGKKCKPMEEVERRQLAFRRANPDYTASPSRCSFNDFDPTAIDQALSLLATQWSQAGEVSAPPQTARELCTTLGVLTETGEPTVAAELLFVKPPSHLSYARHLHRAVPGGEPRRTEISAPLVTTFLRLSSLVETFSSTEISRVQLPTGQEIEIPLFPRAAVDELISNALAHRDYGALNAVVVDQSPTELTVWSPGGFPLGVTESNVLTTQSIPRSPLLMGALRNLGLAEQSSRGFDRMWLSMLSTGRRPPHVVASKDFVEVTLTSGRVDEEYVKAIPRLRDEFGSEVIDSVNGLIVMRHLKDNPILLCSTAAKLMQITEDQARSRLDWFSQQGLINPLRNAPEWVLSDKAQSLLGLRSADRISAVSVEDWIVTQLNNGEVLTSRHVADELGADRKEISEIFSHLRRTGKARIDPTGPQRGPTTRWIAV